MHHMLHLSHTFQDQLYPFHQPVSEALLHRSPALDLVSGSISDLRMPLSGLSSLLPLPVRSLDLQALPLPSAELLRMRHMPHLSHTFQDQPDPSQQPLSEALLYRSQPELHSILHIIPYFHSRHLPQSSTEWYMLHLYTILQMYILLMSVLKALSLLLLFQQSGQQQYFRPCY